MKESPIQQKQSAASEHESAAPESEGKSMAPPAFQLMASDGSNPPPLQRKSSSGGLSPDLINGFANSTGHDLSDVNVHRNSDKPAQVGALAYAQGNDIHLGAGQDQHLAHEAAHIVQQREGRVQPTTEVNGKPVNDSPGLESEADSMGAKAMQMKAAATTPLQAKSQDSNSHSRQLRTADAVDPAVQMVRRLRTDYPWEGVITAPMAAIQVRPIRQCTTTDVQVPPGTRITVLGSTDGFLQVSTTTGTTGYVMESMVDDLVANQISTEMVGAERQWYPSGPVTGAHPARTDFARSAVDPATNMSTIGAHAPTGPGFAAGNNSSSLNCWELLLLSALQVGLIDRAWLQGLYATAGANYQADWISRMTSGAAQAYQVGNPATPRPASGHIVYFNDLSHVVLATGTENARGESEVYSFWPPAGIRPADIVAALSANDPTIMARLHTGRVEVTTIETLSGWMSESDMQPRLGGSGNGAAPRVTFYAPSW